MHVQTHTLQAPACKVALVSTYIPKNCGLATFTASLVQQLLVSPGVPEVCHLVHCFALLAQSPLLSLACHPTVLLTPLLLLYCSKCAPAHCLPLGCCSQGGLAVEIYAEASCQYFLEQM